MKETVAVYGDCQAQALFDVFRRSPGASDHFDFILQFAGDQYRDWRQWSDSLASVSCMLIQDIPQSKTHPTFHDAFSAKRRIIGFPPLSFPSLWPFSTAFGGEDRQADRIKVARGGLGLHTDALLGALRPIKTHDRRLTAYLRLNHSSLPDAERLIARRNPLRFHELDAHRLRRMDEQYQTNVGRYILHNFRERRILHILRHPTVVLISVLARELLQKIAGATLTFAQENDCMDSYQVPIHPVVADELGVRWVRAGQLYRVADERLTIEEYILRYMAFYDIPCYLPLPFGVQQRDWLAQTTSEALSSDRHAGAA